MAFSAVKSLTGMGTMLTRNMKYGLVARAVLSPQMERGFARSLWYMSSQTKPLSNQSDGSKTAPFTKMCGCCGLHTVGDKEMADFLSEEIALERKSEKSSSGLPNIKGFETSKVEGAEIVLSKKTDSETVTVTFNVNDSVEDDGPELEPTDAQSPPQEQPAELVARPSFTVEINKGGDLSLGIACMFTPSEQQSEEDGYDDLIQINEIAILKNGKWEDSTYMLPGSTMDGQMYDMLLNMMEERGMNADFFKDLVDFSTAFENKNYIGLLEELKDFVSCEK